MVCKAALVPELRRCCTAPVANRADHILPCIATARAYTVSVHKVINVCENMRSRQRHIHMYTCTNIYIYIYTRIYLDTLIYIYIYRCIHIYFTQILSIYLCSPRKGLRAPTWQAFGPVEARRGSFPATPGRRGRGDARADSWGPAQLGADFGWAHVLQMGSLYRWRG